MPFLAFEGPAGTGKTYRLIEEVRARTPNLLGSGQRVLGLTFMHGARRRLDENFAGSPEIRGRSHAITIDSFASYVVRRWSAIAPTIRDFTRFDEVCDVCGMLLERPELARWVSASFPIVAIDEAQELKPCRLRIARALSNATNMVVAADEFQCLDENIDTGPFMAWFETGDVQRLNVVRRTGRLGLLNAGVALRAGRPPEDGPGLRIKYSFPNQVKFTIGHALRGGQGTRAILVAPASTPWATELVPQLAAGFRSQRQAVPPLPVAWDSILANEVAEVAERICGVDEQVESAELVRRIARLPDAPSWLSAVSSSVEMARRARGILIWGQLEVRALLVRKSNAHRAYGYSYHHGIRVMTIQAAKNQQFRDVVVLWGPGIRGSVDHQRRLLYNAISRAEQNCTVIVRTQRQLQLPPFV